MDPKLHKSPKHHLPEALCMSSCHLLFLSFKCSLMLLVRAAHGASSKEPDLFSALKHASSSPPPVCVEQIASVLRTCAILYEIKTKSPKYQRASNSRRCHPKYFTQRASAHPLAAKRKPMRSGASERGSSAQHRGQTSSKQPRGDRP